ncbi:hypothetical protein JCM10450v2_001546 [Rhodotorula kratochvilovae]
MAVDLAPLGAPPGAVPPSPSSSLEQYLLLLLSDSNLPTGGFVASSGLEAWIQHGNLALTPAPAAPASPAPPAPSSAPRPRPQSEAALLAFVAHSLHSYARLNVPLLRATHTAVAALVSSAPADGSVSAALDAVLAADAACEALTLNHVARRASTAQGVALLTLYERALAPEVGGAAGELVARYRGAIREGQGGGKAREGGNGHMSVAFAVLTAAVGLGLDAATHLFLFLHARSLLSSAVRLNTVGPYVAHRLLLWDVKPLVDAAVSSTLPSRPGAPAPASAPEERREGEAEDWWDDDPAWKDDWGRDDEKGAPVTTWPLGEIIASRHDQLFTRVFNS